MLMLQDETTGLVAMMNALTEYRDYGVEVPQLDLSDGGTQLYRAWIDQSTYYSTDDVEDIALFVHTNQTRDEHLEKSKDFSGHISVGIDIFLTTENTGIPAKLHRLANLFNDAMYSVFGVLPARQLQADGIVFNGDMTCARTRPAQVGDGENWAQSLSFTLPFQIN